MFRVKIHGWTTVEAYSDDLDKAIKSAIKEKKKRCKDDLAKWNYNTVSEFYGISIEEIKEGSVIVED